MPRLNENGLQQRLSHLGDLRKKLETELVEAERKSSMWETILETRRQLRGLVISLQDEARESLAELEAERKHREDMRRGD